MPPAQRSRCPALGQRTRKVLEDLLGYKSSEVEALAKDGVLGLAA